MTLHHTGRWSLLHARLVVVYRVWQCKGDVCHLIASRLHDLTLLLGQPVTESRDFK